MHLLQIAQETVQAEKRVEPEDQWRQAKSALTELFQETRTETTPAIVEQTVNEIDGIVRIVRFYGWQQTVAGEREVQKALRYQLHRDQELFDKA